MSSDAVEKFFAQVSTDEPLQKAVQAAYQKGVNAEGHAAVAALAAGRGFQVTGDELAKAWVLQQGQLSDDAVEKVAGGAGPTIPSSSFVSTGGIAGAIHATRKA